MRTDRALVDSYLNQRRLIGFLGLGLPLMVVLLGLMGEGPVLRGSISSYYYTNARDAYIAVLASIGIFLISYRGYERVDDIAGNLSGFFALGVIAFPTYRTEDYAGRVGLFMLNERTSDIVHMAFAAMFFFSLAFTSIFLFTRSRGGRVTAAKRRRNRLYVACGLVMVAAILLVVVYLVFFQGSAISRAKPVLVLETIALTAFGISWLVKGKTFKRGGGRSRAPGAS
jgi:magnesium-transporting ATPase (P-type)